MATLRFLLSLIIVFLLVQPSHSASTPYELRISCGSVKDYISKWGILWKKDFGFSGGIATKAQHLNGISPPLYTARRFDSDGPNCYNITGVPRGQYWVRVFYSTPAKEPVFDVFIEGTHISSMKVGWTDKLNGPYDDVFTEALVFITDGSASVCFPRIRLGDLSILSIEILQADANAYGSIGLISEDRILKTIRRISFPVWRWTYDIRISRDPWGGDRFWGADYNVSEAFQHLKTKKGIKKTLIAPNFYQEHLYASAILSEHSDLKYEMEVERNKNYSVWLHFAEIDESVTSAGERVFDVLINGKVALDGVDVIKLSGGAFTALVLNTTVSVSTDRLTLILRSKTGRRATISAMEVFKVIPKKSVSSPIKGGHHKATMSTRKALLMALILILSVLALVAIGAGSYRLFVRFRSRHTHSHCL